MSTIRRKFAEPVCPNQSIKTHSGLVPHTWEFLKPFLCSLVFLSTCKQILKSPETEFEETSHDTENEGPSINSNDVIIMKNEEATQLDFHVHCAIAVIVCLCHFLAVTAPPFASLCARHRLSACMCVGCGWDYLTIPFVNVASVVFKKHAGREAKLMLEASVTRHLIPLCTFSSLNRVWEITWTDL